MVKGRRLIRRFEPDGRFQTVAWRSNRWGTAHDTLARGVATIAATPRSAGWHRRLPIETARGVPGIPPYD